ncbi:MAG: hypothetical protein V2I33_03260 [Kangiellaceae bacterium]|jgi:hypothetical protein|nr:hypothetical protein [Kangiellaceae bacterium]
MTNNNDKNQPRSSWHNSLTALSFLFIIGHVIANDLQENNESSQLPTSIATSKPSFVSVLETSYDRQQIIWLDETDKTSALVEFSSDSNNVYGSVLLVIPINSLPSNTASLKEFIYLLNAYGWNVFSLVLSGDKFSYDGFTENHKVIVDASQVIKQKNSAPLFNLLIEAGADIFLSGLANTPNAQQSSFNGIGFLWPKFITKDRTYLTQPVKFSIPMYVFVDELNGIDSKKTLSTLKRNNAKTVKSLNYPQPGASKEAFSFIARRLHGWQKQITKQSN